MSLDPLGNGSTNPGAYGNDTPPPAPPTSGSSTQTDPAVVVTTDQSPGTGKKVPNSGLLLFRQVNEVDFSAMSDQMLNNYILNAANELSLANQLVKKLFRELYLAAVDAVHEQQTLEAEKTAEGANKVFKYAVVGLSVSLAVSLGAAGWGLKGQMNSASLAKDNTMLNRLQKDLSLEGVDPNKSKAIKDIQDDLVTGGSAKFDFDKHTGSLKQAGFTDKEITSLRNKLNDVKLDPADITKNRKDYLNTEAKKYEASNSAGQYETTASKKAESLKKAKANVGDDGQIKDIEAFRQDLRKGGFNEAEINEIELELKTKTTKDDSIAALDTKQKEHENKIAGEVANRKNALDASKSYIKDDGSVDVAGLEKELKAGGFRDDEIAKIKKDVLSEDPQYKHLQGQFEHYDPTFRENRRDKRLEALDAIGHAKQTKSSSEVAKDLGDPNSDLHKKMLEGGYTKKDIADHQLFFEKSGKSVLPGVHRKRNDDGSLVEGNFLTNRKLERQDRTKLFKDSGATGDNPWDETLAVYKQHQGQSVVVKQQETELAELKSVKNKVEQGQSASLTEHEKGLHKQLRDDPTLIEKKERTVLEAKDDLKASRAELKKQGKQKGGPSLTMDERFQKTVTKDIWMQALLSITSIGGQIQGIGEAKVKGEEYYEAQLHAANATETTAQQQVNADLVHNADTYLGQAGQLGLAGAELLKSTIAFYSK